MNREESIEFLGKIHVGDYIQLRYTLNWWEKEINQNINLKDSSKKDFKGYIVQLNLKKVYLNARNPYIFHNSSENVPISFEAIINYEILKQGEGN